MVVDGNGSINLTDVITISKYLSGEIGATAEQLTRMDPKIDKVIDKQDYNWILNYINGVITTRTTTVEKYANLVDETRTYCVYDCDSGTETSPYTLNCNTLTSNINTRIFETYDDYADSENLNTVQLDLGNGYIGSGFIVAENVVATAAHCVYGTNGYCQDLKVNIYNQEGTEPIDTFDADYIHIPQLYKTTFASEYDYALIKVKNNEDDEDLSQYGIWSLGCITDEFMSTGKDLIASGFTYGVNKPYARYYSCGPVQAKSNNYIVTTLAQSYGGKSGGPIYYESMHRESIVKSVIGIVVSINEPDYRTNGVKITPTHLKFYLNNSNI